MVFRFFVSTISLNLIAGHPVDCNPREVMGRMQVWVPDCKGAGCRANKKDQDCAWYVLNMPLCMLFHGATKCRQEAAARQAQNVVAYKVKSGRYSVEDYVCGGSETLIYYPSDGGNYPVLIYLHGSGGGVDGRQQGLEQVASMGFVVIGPHTGGYPGLCSSATEYLDAATAYTASKNGGSHLHKGLAKADWSRLGIWGFSMGGKTSPEAAVQKGLDVGAVVCEHGARNSSKISMPSMFTTSTEDTSSSSPSLMLSEFDSAMSASKVFANLQGAVHTETISQGYMNPWVAKFFSCHLSESSDACEAVYGNGNGTMCSSNAYSQCITERQKEQHEQTSATIVV